MSSGAGTTARYLLAQHDPSVTWCGVVTDNAHSKTAEITGCVHIPHHLTQAQHELFTEWRVDLVVLVGYMRIIPPELLAEFRMINLHPSLLPRFPGRDAVAQAIRAGAETSGCSVHWVDQGIDTGEVIAQCKVTVQADDDEHTLREKIHADEPLLMWSVIKSLAKCG